MLTPEESLSLEQLLDELAAGLREKLRQDAPEEVAPAAPETDGDPHHESDAPADSRRCLADTAESAHDAGTLLAIEAAQERMRRNTYGFCVACGRPISFDRLLALPTAQCCLTCQEQHEAAASDSHQTLH
ncbi:MAG: TraR/DksA family transcriptional regulator [Betaproteobacteria bacterium]|nr:TraR/DksA family transcriptional regulator [Betaproteobacteria bacterium]